MFFKANTKQKLTNALSAEEAQRIFFANSLHEWITQDRYIKMAFQELIGRLSGRHRHLLFEKEKVVFLRSTGSFSCVVSTLNRRVVLVFSDLLPYLKAPRPDYAMAVLSHELGHIVHQHHLKNLSLLEAQVEADLFVCKMGWGTELEMFLSRQPSSLEVRTRVSYITSYLMNKNEF